jgi:hypothetical protein
LIPTSSTRALSDDQHTPERLTFDPGTMDGDDVSQMSAVLQPVLDQDPQTATQPPATVIDEPSSEQAIKTKLSNAAGTSHREQILDSISPNRLGDSSDEHTPSLTSDNATGPGDNIIVGEDPQEWMPEIDHESKRVKVSVFLVDSYPTSLSLAVIVPRSTN